MLKISSEQLEPIISKTIGEIFEHFALGYWDYNECLVRINALSHFVGNCNAIHCELAIGNIIGLWMRNEKDPNKLKELFKQVTEKHYSLC